MFKTLRQISVMSVPFITLGTFAAAAPPGTGNPTAVQPQPSTGAGAHDSAAINKQIDDLRLRLQITPAQQAQWDVFAQVMRANARDMDETFRVRARDISTLSATENMKSYAGISAQHARDMEHLVPAFASLYDTMSNNQKRIADQVFRDNANLPRRGGG